ncbi:4Fe-4S dicluster domain-containing protein [bacterium]|nr:4Fe-4S dicluster domain-containing protein [bacterium]
MNNKLDRRGFLKTTAVGGATALLTACNNDPVEDLIPFLIPPDDFVPGKSIHFATICKECPAQCGMVIRTREGRAVKAEGNPLHPLNRGSLCAVGQASLQGLYNPNRVKHPFKRTKEGSTAEITWEQGLDEVSSRIRQIEDSGSGQRILYLSRPGAGTLIELIDNLVRQLKSANRIVFDMTPVNSLLEAGNLVFGKKEIPLFRFEKAKRLINFGADFMESWLNPVESMRAFSESHSYSEGRAGKYIHIAPHISLTGTNADDQLICRPGDEILICLSLAYLLTTRSKTIGSQERTRLLASLSPYQPEKISTTAGFGSSTLNRIAEEIGVGGNSLVIGGGNCAAGVDNTKFQAAIYLVNFLAGNIGKTIQFGTGSAYPRHDLKEFAAAIKQMKQGRIGMVIFDNVNPVYAFPKEADLKEALNHVPYIVSLSTSADETSEFADIHLPVSHPLESWGDSNPRKGIFGLQQPVMSKVPGYQTLEAGELILGMGKRLNLMGFEAPGFYHHLKESWKHRFMNQGAPTEFEPFWKRSLQEGGWFEAFQPQSVKLSIDPSLFTSVSRQGNGMRLLPVNTVFHNANGYSGDKPWLLEVPEPVTQTVWDSWAAIHPVTAKNLGVNNRDLIRVSNGKGRSITIAVWLYHGMSENCVAISTGMGRKIKFPDYTHYKRDLFIPTKTSDPKRLKEIIPGVNPMDLLSVEFDQLSGDLVLCMTEVEITSLGRQSDLVTVDGHYRPSKSHDQKQNQPDLGQKGRNLVRADHIRELTGDHGKSRDHHLKDRHYSVENNENKRSFYGKMSDTVKKHPYNLTARETPEYYNPYRWEMAIDLDRCTGCSACVVACYAENNIAVVGKERQSVGREMSWLRIERYFDRDEKTNRVTTNFSPQMCNQCENAGCEPVCPLYATYHNPDGINTMIYARCAGTRYCANNCIYKSRKFNWRSYIFPSPLHLQLNPDVTVRDKGVMEKCTFCIQRIKDVKELAKRENRQVREGEIKTACQQACPSRAITFGNGQDKSSAVSTLKMDKRAYQQLAELNFKPAVTYLKKIKKT